MGSNEFFLQSNNGKRIKFENFKKLKSEDFAQNSILNKLITLFDKDLSGDINTVKEWNTIFQELSNIALSDGDNNLTFSEMGLFLRGKSINEEIKEEDYDDLFTRLSEANSRTNTVSYEEDGVNYENVITVVDDKIQKVVRKQDGIVVSTTEYTYLDNGTIKLNTKNLNNTQVETLVSEVDEDGNYFAENFISRTTTLHNEEVVNVSKLESGHIIETVVKGDKSLTTIYNTSSIYAYDYFNGEDGLKFAQVYTNAGNEYFVRYDNGNTITHAASGDGLERLTRNFGFENVEHFYELNPDLRGKVIQVGQDVVVPNILAANDPVIIRQGTLEDEQKIYLEHMQKLEIQKFKDENFANINQEFFELLQTIEGFELNNDNIHMYTKISLLDENVQNKLMAVFEGLKNSNSLESLSPYDIKKMILTSPTMPKVKMGDGVEIPINLFAGTTLTLKDPVTSVVDTEVDFSYEMFIKEKLGLDITTGRGKELYERMLSITDIHVLTDMITMFDNIRMRSDKYLYENFKNTMQGRLDYCGGAGTTSGKGYKMALDNNKALTEAQSKEMYQAVILELTEPPQRTSHHAFVENLKDSYLRQFASDMICMLYEQGGSLFEAIRANKGKSSPSKYLLAIPQQVYQQNGGDIHKQMNWSVYLGNDQFSQIQQGYTYGVRVDGKPFDKAQIKKCYEVMADKNASETAKKQALINAFGAPIVNEAEDLIDTTDFLDNVTDIALITWGTGIIGSGLTAGASALRGTSAVQKAVTMFNGVTKGQRVTNFVTQMGISSATFAIYDGLKYTIDYYTNDIDETQLGEHSYSYLEGLGTTVKHSAAFGAFASAWGQLVTSNLLKASFKTPQAAEVSAQAMRTVNRTLGNSAKFSSAELMSAYSNAQTKAMSSAGREAVSFASELVGFSIWEGANQYISSNGEKTVGEILEGQFATLLSFKAVGHIIKMHKAGKGFGAVNNFGKTKPLEFEQVTENGKTAYKVKYPDGKESFVKDINEAVLLSNTYYENKTLYEPLEEILKNEKVDLGEGIVISKEGNNYVIDLNGKTKISEPNLKMAMLKAQNQYSFLKLEERARTEHEITLPNQMKITYDKENNMYETTLESGTKIKAENVEKLLTEANNRQMIERIDAAIAKKGSILFGENIRITKEDNSYKAEIILNNGQKFVVKQESINDALTEINFIQIMNERISKVITEDLNTDATPKTRTSTRKAYVRPETTLRGIELETDICTTVPENNFANSNTTPIENEKNKLYTILNESKSPLKECSIIDEYLSDIIKLAQENPEIPSDLIYSLLKNPNIDMFKSLGKYITNDVSDIIEICKKYPEHQTEILNLAAKETFYPRDLKEQINRPETQNLIKILGFEKAIAFQNNTRTEIDPEHFETLNEIIIGPKGEQLSNFERHINQGENSNIHFDNDFDITSAEKYSKLIQEVKTNLKKMGVEFPTEIYITQLPKNVIDNIVFSEKNPNAIFINPRYTDIRTLKEQLTTAILAQNIYKDLPLVDKELGTKTTKVDGVETESLDKDIRRNINSALNDLTSFIDRSNYTIMDFLTEVGRLISTGQIEIKTTKINGVIIDRKFTYKYNDGSDIIEYQINALNNMMKYYFQVGGKDFSPEQNLPKEKITLNSLQENLSTLGITSEIITSENGNTLVKLNSATSSIETERTFIEFDANGKLITIKENVKETDVSREFPNYNYKIASYETLEAKLKELIAKTNDSPEAELKSLEWDLKNIQRQDFIYQGQIEFLDFCLEQGIKFDFFGTMDALKNINSNNIKIIKKIFEQPETVIINGVESKHTIKKERFLSEINFLLKQCKTPEETKLVIELLKNENVFVKKHYNNQDERSIDIRTLTDAVINYKTHPTETNFLMSLNHIPTESSIKFLCDSTSMPTELKLQILEIMDLKNAKGNNVFDQDRFMEEYDRFHEANQTADISEFPYLNFFLNGITEADAKIIKKFIKNHDETPSYDSKELLKTLANIKTKTPNDYPKALKLLNCNSKSITYSDIEEFLKFTEEKQNEILNILQENATIFDKITITIDKINAETIEKLKMIFMYKDILGKALNNLAQIMIYYSEVNIELIENTIKRVKQNPDLIKAVKTHIDTFNNLLMIEYYTSQNMLPKKVQQDFENAIIALNKQPKENFNHLMDALTQTCIRTIVSPSKTELTNNINAIFEAGIQNSKSSTLSLLLKTTNVDFVKNKQILDDILTNKKDLVIKTLTQKCQNTCPEFVETIKALLEDKENLSLFLALPNLSIKTFTDELFSIAKMSTYINTKPQDYVNGFFSQKLFDIVKTERTKGKDNNLTKNLTTEEAVQLGKLQEQITENFDNKICDILLAINATDPETVKLLLDMRFNDFVTNIETINCLSTDAKIILNDMITNGKRINKNGEPAKLAGHEKLDLINIITTIYNLKYSKGIDFDIEKYKMPINSKEYVIDFLNLRKDLFNKILLTHGLSEAEIADLKPENMNWDFSKISLFAKQVVNDNGELSILIREACRGNFKNYINDPSNPHGAANIETKRKFAERNLDYDAYQTGPQTHTITMSGKEYSIKLWNRVPQESIHDGKTTNCCTALDGCNGGAMANYMLNTAINVVEMKDSKGTVLAMSRCYVAIVDGKPAMIIENIEANNKFKSSESDGEAIVTGLHNYIKEYAKMVGGEDMPIYMSTSYQHVTFDFKANFKTVNKKIEFVGNMTKDLVYLNTFAGQVNVQNLAEQAEFYIIKE